MPAGADAKVRQPFGLGRRELRTAATRAAGGAACRSRSTKAVDRVGRGLGVDFHAGLAIEHPAENPLLDRRAIDKRPKPDALHDAANRQPASNVGELASACMAR